MRLLKLVLLLILVSIAYSSFANLKEVVNIDGSIYADFEYDSSIRDGFIHLIFLPNYETVRLSELPFILSRGSYIFTEGNIKEVVADGDIYFQSIEDGIVIKPLSANNVFIVKVADKDYLYKCEKWDIEVSECKGQWNFVRELKPGRPYLIYVGKGDPAFIESNNVTNVSDHKSGLISACGTYSTSNIVYSLTNNLTSNGTCLQLIGENITLDCEGNWIEGNNGGYGVFINDGLNVTIKNCNIKGFLIGIYIQQINSPSLLQIYNSHVENNTYGVYGENIYNAQFYEMNITNNTYGALFYSSNKLNLSNTCFCYNKVALLFNKTSNIEAHQLNLKHSTSHYPQLYLINTENAFMSNMTIINVTNYVSSEGLNKNITLHNFSIGFNEEVGKVIWPSINGTNLTLNNKNVILKPNFISINSSIQDLASSAFGFLKPEVCSSIVFYKKGFPKTREEILKEGVPYEGKVFYCNSTSLKFAIDHFSGFTSLPLSKCAYLTQDNGHYFLTRDLKGTKDDGVCITVNASNISLNGDGFKIEGDGSGIAISSKFSNFEAHDLLIKDYTTGIYLSKGERQNIFNISFEDMFYGIKLNKSTFNISNNLFGNVNVAVYSEMSKGMLSNNTIKQAYVAIGFINSNNSTIFSNNISNVSIGLNLTSSKNNKIFNNIFYFTSQEILGDVKDNVWNTTYNCSEKSIVGGCLGGNLWVDYSGFDINGDKIGETPYPITNSTYDYLPLTFNTSISTCFEANQPNRVYELSSSLIGNLSSGVCIVINADNVTIDCRGYEIIGNSKGTVGILSTFDRTHIKNCVIENYSKGIFLKGISNATLFNNSISNIEEGLFLDSVSYLEASLNKYWSNNISLTSINSYLNNFSNELFFNQTFYMNISGSNLAFQNVTFAYNETIGKVVYDKINLKNIQLKNNSNIILDPWFVSVKRLKGPAIIKLYTENCDYRPFKADGFYTSRQDIIRNGYGYEPTSWNCYSNVATFGVDNFSSYTTYLKLGSMNGPIKGPENWWNCSFSYREVINITNNGTSDVNYTGFIDLKGPFAHFNNNCSDVRVISETNETLPFVVEKCDEGGVRLVVDVGTVFSNYTKQIFVYYGNSQVDSLSNISQIQSMEVRKVYFVPQTYAGEWTLNITFNHSFNDPVVILEPDVTNNGSDELTFRIRNLNASGFEARQQEPSNRDDMHQSGEVAYYIALDEGIYVTPNGKKIRVWKGYVNEAVNGDSLDSAGTSWRTFSFNPSMSDPVVLSQILDFNSVNYVHTRGQNLDSSGFQLALEPEGNQSFSDVNQSLVGWIAFESDIGEWFHKKFEFNKTSRNVTHIPYLIDFGNLHNKPPGFIGWLSSYYGRDSCVIRGEKLSNNTIYVSVEEDLTMDSEKSHVPEIVSYAVLDTGLYPLGDYNPNISVVVSNEGYIANATLNYPPNDSFVEKDKPFLVNCSFIKECNTSCSDKYVVYLQFLNGTSWDALTSDYVNLIADNCNTTYNVSFNASIHQYNASFLIRCLFESDDDASVSSNSVLIKTRSPKIKITYPNPYQIVFTDDDLIIHVSEIEENYSIKNITLFINGSEVYPDEVGQDEWEYVWHIPSNWPEGLVKIEAVAYNSSADAIARDRLYVYVFKEIICNWWNSSWKYRVPIYVDKPGILNVFLPENFDYSLLNADGSDIRFVDVNNNEIPYWVEYWRHWKLNKTSIWVNTNSSLIYMYFGNPFAQSKSNRSAVFSSESNFRYIVLTDISNTYGINMSGYENNTEVSSSSWTTTLDSQETVNEPFTTGLKINSTKPINGIVLGNNGDIISPLSWEGKQFTYMFGSRSASVDRWIIYAFRPTNLKIYVLNNLIKDINLSEDSTTVFDADIPNGKSALIFANDSVVISHRETNNRDSTTLYPAFKELYGVSSAHAYVSALEDNTLIEVYRSDGTFYNIVLNRGENYELGGGSSEGRGSAIRLVSNKPIGAHQMADFDGVEETVFLPLKELDNIYVIPSSTQYISITCPFNNTKIEVYSPSGNLVSSTVCTSSGENFPGKAYFGTVSDTVNFNPGTLVVANESIFLYYENIDPGDSLGEETNAISYKQFRVNSDYSFGKIVERTSDILVYPFHLTDFRECEEQNISVVVGNIGIDSTFNISLLYELNGVNYTVDKKEISLMCGENTTVVFNWNHTTGTCGVGNREVYVFGDSDESVNELDEVNNVKQKSIMINYSLIIYPNQRRIEVSRDITTQFRRTLQLRDLSYLDVKDVNLNYSEGSPSLPANCVDIQPNWFDEINNSEHALFNFTINVTCANDGQSYGEIIASGKDFAEDHSLSNYSYSFMFSKQSQGFVFTVGNIDFDVVEPNSSKSVELEIFNNDDTYDIESIIYNFSVMEAQPLPYIIHSSSITGEDVTPILPNTSKNATITLNLSNQMPGNYSGNVAIVFNYNDIENSTIHTNLSTHVLVPWVKDVDGDSVNEHAFDYDNDGNPDLNSFEDPNGIASILWQGSINGGKNSFIIDNNGDGEPDVYWDPTFYNDNMGLLTLINKTDVNNDTVDEYLIDLDGDGWYDILYFDGKLYPLPDLNVTNIQLSPDQLQHENITTEITVVVRNEGFNASNFILSIYADNSIVSSQQISFLEENNSITLSFNYTPQYKGLINITARVDTTDVIYESNDSWQFGWEESNNEISTLLLSNASMWHVFYGNISGLILLATNNTSIFYQWHWNGNGRIYAVTQGADISWINLTALGKDVDGNNSTSDFVELDSLLNTSLFPDSIAKTYSSDGSHANSTKDLKIHKRWVRDVPVHYSSHHFTGILWDASDSSNNEFDIGDNEDIVFVNEFNTSSSYTYTIEVPSTLDTYKGGNVVEFWVELD